MAMLEDNNSNSIEVGSDWKGSLEIVKNGLEKEDYKVVIANCCEWTTTSKKDEVPGPVQTTMMRIYLRALLVSQEYSKVVELCTGMDDVDNHNNNNKNNSHEEEHMYALYRLQDYRACLRLIASSSSSGSLFCQHVRAQCHYRLKETHLAYPAYQDILSTIAAGNEKQDCMEVWTNICAVGLANDYYFDNGNDANKDNMKTFLDDFLLQPQQQEDIDYPYELAYNYGTWLALQGKSRDAKIYLQFAVQHATNEEERMAIQFTMQQLQQQSTSIGEDDEDALLKYPHLNWVVQQHQHSTSTLLKPQDITLLHLTPSQVRKYWYNQCVIRLNHNQKRNKKKVNDDDNADNDDDDEFYLMMDQLMLHVGNMDDQKNKKKQQNTMMNRSHELYWITKAAILNHLNQSNSKNVPSSNNNMKKKKKMKKKIQQYPTLEQVEEMIQMETEKQKSSQKDDDRSGGEQLLELAHIHLQLYKSQQTQHQNKKSSIPDIISTLESLPTRPAIQATLASLYQRSGQPDKVQNILNNLRQQSSDHDKNSNNNNMAQLYMQMSMYTNALELFSDETNNDATCQAMKVIAHYQLGQVDLAVDEWKSFKEENDLMDDNIVDGEALEADIIPRLHKSNSTPLSSKGHDSKKKKEKKHREAILQRRAKQRDAYLEKHPDLKDKTPDAERWIPKRDRVAKRRYNNKHMNAAQGITSQKDMNKLDAYARTTNPQTQQQQQPSTRHLSVSSTGKSRRPAR